MEEARRPIAVFDSGVGGISVLRALVELMPNENFIYFGDSARAPYGSKSLKEVRELTEMHVTHLLEIGAKAVVIACNTATSADITILRERYSHIPMIGIEPALKPAVLHKEYPTVAVMGTPMTIYQEKFRKLLDRYERQAKILLLPCPGLVEFVERGELYGRALEQYLQQLFESLGNEQIDSVVLGCTHYPFVSETLKKVLGQQIVLFDGGAGTARETRRQLAARQLLNPSIESGIVRFENSEYTPQKMKLCQFLLNY